MAIDLFLAGIDTVSVPFGSLNEDGHFELTLTNLPSTDEEVLPEMSISDLPVGSWHHYALCKDGDSLRFYLDGQLMFSAMTVTDYWDLYVPIESAPFQYFYVKNGSLPIMCSLMITDNNDIGVSAVHGLRFTPQALYTGAFFTPPTSITELA